MSPSLELELKALPDTDKMTLAQVVQANLADIGITVNIIPTDPGPFWNLGLESKGDDWKDLQLYIHEFGDAPDPSQMTQWYVSEQVGVWNWERWKDPEFDKLHYAGLAGERPGKSAARCTSACRRSWRIRGLCLVRLQAGTEDLSRTGWSPSSFPGDHPYTQWFKKA